jgi:hypothetical protein
VLDGLDEAGWTNWEGIFPVIHQNTYAFS